MTNSINSAPAEAQVVPGGAVGPKLQFVAFALGGQRYAIDIMAVREIRISNPITSLPGAPDYIRGVTNLRGTIIPVMDLRLRFGLAGHPNPAAGVVIVAALNGKLTGLLVDEVCDILSPPAGAVNPIPDADPGHASPYFAGLVTDGETMLIVLAPNRLLSPSGDECQRPAAA